MSSDDEDLFEDSGDASSESDSEPSEDERDEPRPRYSFREGRSRGGGGRRREGTRRSTRLRGVGGERREEEREEKKARRGEEKEKEEEKEEDNKGEGRRRRSAPNDEADRKKDEDEKKEEKPRRTRDEEAVEEGLKLIAKHDDDGEREERYRRRRHRRAEAELASDGESRVVRVGGESLRVSPEEWELMRSGKIRERRAVRRFSGEAEKKKKRRRQREEESSSDESHFRKKQAAKLEQRRLDVQPLSSSVKADICPVAVDSSVIWDSVGGLDRHVTALKEMVMLPLLYPSLFQGFGTRPPRGVLFFGPPGTGKTLVARALANSCLAANGTKVSFFYRKGADILSKWIGEAERQLRLLFETAAKMQPSIIFFDEIDGLAPVRSSKQDQIHSSIVATLLALLDGLEDRGSVVVIGATNRPDAVDPALRRPGRFDRELRFDLPDREARDTILRIHTRNWRVPLADDLREWLAENTPNFCGADLGLLCSEAALAAVKTRFPQLLSENVALQFDPTKVEVDKLHWQLALQAVVPAAQKNAANHARKLSRPEAVLLEEDERLIVAQVRSMFPPMLRGNLLPGVNFVDNTLTVDTREPPPVYRPRLLVNGPANCGQQQLCRAALHALAEDGVRIVAASFADVFASPLPPESAIPAFFNEISRARGAAVLYLGDVRKWSAHVPATAVAMLESMLESLPHDAPVLLLGYCNDSEEHELFPRMFGAKRIARNTSMMLSLIGDALSGERGSLMERSVAPLSLAPKKSGEKKEGSGEEKKKSEAEEEEEEREAVWQWKQMLREICNRILDAKRFRPFHNCVDLRQVPDYAQLIRDPIWVKLIHERVGEMRYSNMDQFEAEFRRILANTKRYNPADDEANLPEKAVDMADKVAQLIYHLRRDGRVAPLEALIARHLARNPGAGIPEAAVPEAAAVVGSGKKEEEEEMINEDECAVCGEGGLLLCCDDCPRAFHFKCVGLAKEPDNYVCPQCLAKQRAAVPEVPQAPKVPEPPVLLPEAVPEMVEEEVPAPEEPPILWRRVEGESEARAARLEEAGLAKAAKIFAETWSGTIEEALELHARLRAARHDRAAVLAMLKI